jgi:hypothetical protein
MVHRHRKDLAALRRRVEDEGDEEGGPDAGDLDDDSLSEGSLLSDEEDAQEGDEVSTFGAAPEAAPELPKTNGNGNHQELDGKGRPTNGVKAPGPKKNHQRHK